MTPITIEFDLPVTAEHAFDVWTRRCSVWWPRSHTMSGGETFEVVFEPFAGGRIYERGADGAEHEWGEVILWDPPSRLEYAWHIFFDRDKATKVALTFIEKPGGVAVHLVNSGLEIFGDGATERSERVGGAWRMIIGEYRAVA